MSKAKYSTEIPRIIEKFAAEYTGDLDSIVASAMQEIKALPDFAHWADELASRAIREMLRLAIAMKGSNAVNQEFFSAQFQRAVKASGLKVPLERS